MTDTNQPTRTKRGLDPAVAAELGDLLHELSGNPETRRDLAKLVKKAKPDSEHARAFRDVEVEDRFDEFRREQEEKDIKREQERVLARMNEQKRGLLEGTAGGRKYSEEDVGKIEALMQKKGITDYDDGATLYAATLPPETPKPAPHLQPPGANWELPDLGKFAVNPWKAGREEAHNVIGEFMRKRA